MLRAPVLHAFVLLGTTCQLTTGPRALKTDKLTGRGVPTSIGALSV